MQRNGANSTLQVTRLLIVTYIVGISIGLVSGAELSRLAKPFLPETPAVYASRLVVLALCAMVLFNVYRQTAARLLALIIFWASYITLFSGGEIGSFWRDLALVGGLLLSAGLASVHETGCDDEPDLPETNGPEPTTERVALRRGASVSRFREDFSLANND